MGLQVFHPKTPGSAKNTLRLCELCKTLFRPRRDEINDQWERVLILLVMLPCRHFENTASLKDIEAIIFFSMGLCPVVVGS